MLHPQRTQLSEPMCRYGTVLLSQSTLPSFLPLSCIATKKKICKRIIFIFSFLPEEQVNRKWEKKRKGKNEMKARVPTYLYYTMHIKEENSSSTNFSYKRIKTSLHLHHNGLLSPPYHSLLYYYNSHAMHIIVMIIPTELELNFCPAAVQYKKLCLGLFSEHEQKVYSCRDYAPPFSFLRTSLELVRAFCMFLSFVSEVVARNFVALVLQYSVQSRKYS